MAAAYKPAAETGLLTTSWLRAFDHEMIAFLGVALVACGAAVGYLGGGLDQLWLVPDPLLDG